MMFDFLLFLIGVAVGGLIQSYLHQWAARQPRDEE